MKPLLQQLWRVSLQPVYDWMFGRFFDAIVSRLDELLRRWGEITAIRGHLEELDAHVRSALAARWETEALGRRIAMLEDRLAAADAGLAEPEAVAELEREADGGAGP